ENTGAETDSDKEVFDALFYPRPPGAPDRIPAHPVRPGRRPALRRRPLRRARRPRLRRGRRHLARGGLHPAADPAGVPGPGAQPRRLLPGRRGPRPGLAAGPRRAALLAPDRPLLQGPPAPARVPAAAAGPRDRPGAAVRRPGGLALAGPPGQGG